MVQMSDVATAVRDLLSNDDHDAKPVFKPDACLDDGASHFLVREPRIPGGPTYLYVAIHASHSAAAPASAVFFERLTRFMGKLYSAVEGPFVLVVGGDWNDPLFNFRQRLEAWKTEDSSIPTVHAYAAGPDAVTGGPLPDPSWLVHADQAPAGASIDYVFVGTCGLPLTEDVRHTCGAGFVTSDAAFCKLLSDHRSSIQSLALMNKSQRQSDAVQNHRLFLAAFAAYILHFATTSDHRSVAVHFPELGVRAYVQSLLGNSDHRYSLIDTMKQWCGGFDEGEKPIKPKKVVEVFSSLWKLVVIYLDQQGEMGDGDAFQKAHAVVVAKQADKAWWKEAEARVTRGWLDTARQAAIARSGGAVTFLTEYMSPC